MADINLAAKGVFWSAIDRFASQGCQFVLGIIIARLIDPVEYGKLAMATVLLSIAEMVVDCGFTNALIQKKDKSDSDFSTVFWTNLTVGVIVYFVLFLCAPLIASFYNIPELTSIVKVISISIVLYSLYIIQRTRFVIAINFKTQSFISITAVIVSGLVGVVMAYLGYGVWALITQSLIFSSVSLLFYWVLSKWRPSFSFSKESFKSLFGFGSKLMATGVITTLYNNMYTIVIAKFFSAKELGLYNRGEAFAKVPMSNITMILARVIYPIECEWQDNNYELLKKYNQFLRVISFVIFPLMFGLAVLAEPVVLAILTEKWAGSIPILQILCFVALYDPIIRLTWDIFNVKHRSDLSLLNEIINKSVAILVLVLTIQYGIRAVCFGMLLYSIINVLIMTHFTNKVLPGLTFLNVLKQIFPYLLMSLAMFFIMRFSIILIENNLLKILVGMLVGGITYITIAHLTHSNELLMIKGLAYQYLSKFSKKNK
jgi:O-antigen/teichoic acid export membrane protein